MNPPEADSYLSVFPRIPRQFRYSEDARRERLAFLQDHTACDLSSVNSTSLDPESLRGINGNTIGSVEVPVGIAGPLLFRGNEACGMQFAPLGTCEGALVESVTRGALAITRSGGVYARTLEQRMKRVPIFTFVSVEDAVIFSKWIVANEMEIRLIAQTESSHGRCVSVVPRISGRYVHVEFTYTTGDAAGQNISTACTSVACTWIRGQLGAAGIEPVSFGLEGNMSSDKKVSYNSFINGRGIRVVAETVLKKDVIAKVLNVTPQALYSGHLRGINGAIEAGMVGYNINVANVITAMFVATGQDIACAHESSMAHLAFELDGEDVYASLTLPGLIVGTVGGATRLPAQRELLQMLDCYGDGKVYRFAEIIAGFCLALDISTLSAMVSDVFASAHERLARKPTKAFLVTE